MQISDAEVKRVLASTKLVQQVVEIVKERDRKEDEELVKRVRDEVLGMSDREDRIAELKAKIESGQYKVSGDEIAEGMIRRAIADNIR